MESTVVTAAVPVTVGQVLLQQAAALRQTAQNEKEQASRGHTLSRHADG